MRKKKILSIVLALTIMTTTIFGILPSITYAAQSTSSDINKIDDKKYPGVKSLIQNLQKQHKNWKFKVYYTGLDWNSVISAETKSKTTNLIYQSYKGAWINGTTKYSGGKWYSASTKAVKYIMDSRNSLNSTNIFQFMNLTYDSSVKYDSGIIKKLLTNTFLDDGKLDTHIKTIMNRCKEKNVNPYFVAVKIIQEQGTKGGATYKMKNTENSSEEAQIDTKNKIVKVVAGMTVKKINSALGKKYKIKNKNKKEIKETDTVATGYTTNDNYTIVVLGDVNGDGKVKATDYMGIKNNIMGSKKLDTYQKLAADANLDGNVKATDYMRIKNYIMGTSKIKFEKVGYYYNIFNVNAGGNTVSQIISNAFNWAKDKGWDTIDKSLIGGIDFISSGYLAVGQNTLYFEKFDVVETGGLYSHQYAQDVFYAQNQGSSIRKMLENIKSTEFAYTFTIPLYENMPKTACAKP